MDKHLHDMDTSVCITNQQWLDYSDKKLSEKEMLALNAHVTTCEICLDIKDGIDLMANSNLLNQKISQINQHVDEKILRMSSQGFIAKPKQKILWLSMAATAILVCGVTLYLLNPSADDLAYSTPNNQTLQDSQALMPSDNAYLNAPEIKANSKPIPEPILPEKTSPTQVMKAPEIQEADADDEPINNGDIMPQEEESIPAKIEDVTSKALVQPDKKAMIVLAEKAQKFPAPLLNNLSNNAYSNAYAIDNLTIANHSDSVQYAIALQLFDQNNLDSCNRMLQPILSNTQSTSYTNAQFLNAKICIRQQKYSEAKLILQQLQKVKNQNSLPIDSILKTLKD